MRSLTVIESKEWLGSFGVEVLGDLDSNMNNMPLGFRAESDAQRQEVFCLVPGEAGSAEVFAAQIMEWLPAGDERLFLLTHWLTYPDRRVPLFELIRRGWGEDRSLSDAPGFLFQSAENENVEERQKPTNANEAILCGLVFLSICYTWEGYIISMNSRDFIFLGDGFVQFSSTDSAKIDEAKSLIETFQLQPRTTSPWS